MKLSTKSNISNMVRAYHRQLRAHPLKWRCMKANGEKIRDLRDAKLLTSQQLADLAGVSRDVIYRLENEKSGAHQTSIKRIARVLGVEPKELLPDRNGGKGGKTEKP